MNVTSAARTAAGAAGAAVAATNDTDPVQVSCDWWRAAAVLISDWSADGVRGVRQQGPHERPLLLRHEHQ